MSSPARGTWIEIQPLVRVGRVYAVVPRKGDVDRNEFAETHKIDGKVVPRKGDVDRNPLNKECGYDEQCRPPQGGRG